MKIKENILVLFNMQVRLLFLLIIIFLGLQFVNGQTIIKTKKIDGLKYNLYSNGVAILIDARYNNPLVIPSTVEYKDKTYIVRDCITYYSGITNITFPGTIKTIRYRPRYSVEDLFNITFSEGVEKIEDFTFFKSSASFISLPSSLKYIGNCALPNNFKDNNSFQKLNSLEYIGNSVFSQNMNIKSIALPNIKHIGSNAFFKCENLESVFLSNSLDSIKSGTFKYCSNLKTILIPSSVKYIGAEAFAHCKNLESVIIPNSVEYIGIRAFEDCKSIKSIVIPNSIKYVGAEAFYGCENLESVTLPENEPTVFSDNEYSYANGVVFRFCENLSEIKTNNLNFVPYCEKGNNNWFDYSAKYNKHQRPFISSSFSYFAYDKIKSRMQEWQKKKEYETTAQWKERVTEANRQEQLTKVIDKVRKEYISQKAPKVLKGNLGMFDADYGVYPINASGINNIFYAQVPLGEAQAFKENWDKVVMQPTYGVVDDQLGILSCTFKLGNKTYPSTRNYSNDNDKDMAITLPPLEINLNEEEKDKSEHRIIQVDNSIDLQIPVTNETNTNTFAVIIGNENYQRVSKVKYALNDAKIFAEYCQKTLGLPKNNIRSYTDATYGTMLAALKDISDIANAYNGDLVVIFYYAGHGIPDGKGNAFLLPIDADGTQLEVCLAINTLYNKLNELKAKKTIVLMDACFSGAQRGEGMLIAARGVAIKAKQNVPQGNSVIFCAANGEETAFPYQEKGHGMFTYFLLKKLQETKGETTLGELVDYVTTNVSKQSVVVNRKKQTPTVIPSLGAMGWQSETLK